MKSFQPVNPYEIPEPDSPDFTRRLRQAISRLSVFGEQTDASFARILKGEVPDGSGGSIGDVSGLDGAFLLQGRSVDQIAHGSLNAGGNLTLVSANSATKGKIFLGRSQTQMAFDETTGWVGVGTVSPSAVLTLSQGSSEQYGRADGETAPGLGGWRGEDGDSTSIYEHMNEVVANDATYIQQQNGGTSYTFTCPDPGVIAPTSIELRFHARKNTATVNQLTVSLSRGGNTIMSNKDVGALVQGPTFTPLTYSLTAAEVVDFLSGVGTLSLSLVFGGAAPDTCAVSWFEVAYVSGATSDMTRWYTNGGATLTSVVDTYGRLGVGTSSPTSMGMFVSDSASTTALTARATTSQSADIFEVQNAAGASDWLRVASDGQSFFASSTTAGVVNIAWSAGGIALQVGTSGSSTTINHVVEASVYNHRVLGTGAITWRHNTAGNALAGTWDGNFLFQPPTGTTTTVPLTVTGRTSQSVALLNLIPVTSHTGNTLQIRNIGDTATVHSVGPTGTTLIDTVGTVVGLQIKSTGSAAANGDSLQVIASGSATVLSRFGGQGHLAIGTTTTNTRQIRLVTTDTDIINFSSSNTDTARTGGSGAAVELTTDWSNPGVGIIGDSHCLNINHAVADAACNAFAINGQVTGSGEAGSPGTATFHALHFAATSGGSVDVLEVTGMDVEGSWNGDSGATCASLLGINARFNILDNGGGSVATMAAAAVFDMNLDQGTVGTAYGITVNVAATGSTVTTLYGLNIGDMTTAAATTTWAIHSAGGDSSHAGDFRFGSNSAPTAKVHMDAGSTSAGSAPAKYEAGSLMSAVEAGAREYDGDFHYLTNATTRGAICSTANVVVDGDGNVVTADGEILLAA